jgi:hypothetical protein
MLRGAQSIFHIIHSSHLIKFDHIAAGFFAILGLSNEDSSRRGHAVTLTPALRFDRRGNPKSGSAAPPSCVGKKGF